MAGQDEADLSEENKLPSRGNDGAGCEIRDYATCFVAGADATCCMDGDSKCLIFWASYAHFNWRSEILRRSMALPLMKKMMAKMTKTVGTRQRASQMKRSIKKSADWERLFGGNADDNSKWHASLQRNLLSHLLRAHKKSLPQRRCRGRIAAIPGVLQRHHCGFASWASAGINSDGFGRG